jgi:hypothetical protein
MKTAKKKHMQYNIMKSLERLQGIFSAVAFAEAGEFETAVRMIDKIKGKGATNNTDKHCSEIQNDIEFIPSSSSS